MAIDRPERDFDQMIRELSEHFVVHYNDGLELLTIRYFTPEAVAESTNGRSIYVEQRTRKIVRFLLK